MLTNGYIKPFVSIKLVEMTGIEPVSENLSTRLSPSAACCLEFPIRSVNKHTLRHSSLQYIRTGAGVPVMTFTAHDARISAAVL